MFGRTIIGSTRKVEQTHNGADSNDFASALLSKIRQQFVGESYGSPKIGFHLLPSLFYCCFFGKPRQVKSCIVNQDIQLVDVLEQLLAKRKVLYKLTQKGIDLLPIMIEINLWAEKYFIIPEERRAMLEEVKKDKPGSIKKMTQDLLASNEY